MIRIEGSAFTISIRSYANGEKREHAFRMMGPLQMIGPRCIKSIAGPVIFAHCEGFLVHTSFMPRSGKRVAFAPGSRGYVLNCRRRK